MKRAPSAFAERCYALLREVPEGKVTTYGEIARALHTKAWRAVGHAMSINPYMPEVPCHRVIRSDGRMGGYAFGADKKAALLRAEGVHIVDGKIAASAIYHFSDT